METKSNNNQKNDEPKLSDEKLAKFLSNMTDESEEEDVYRYVESHPETLSGMFNVVSSIKAGQKVKQKNAQRRKSLTISLSLAASVAILVVVLTQMNNGAGVYVSDTDSIEVSVPDKLSGTWVCGKECLLVQNTDGQYQCTYTNIDVKSYSAIGRVDGDSITMEFRTDLHSGEAKCNTASFLTLSGSLDGDGNLVLTSSKYTEYTGQGRDFVTSDGDDKTIIFTKQ